MNEEAAIGYVKVIKLIQPYMAVNSCTFIKPSFILGGIYAHYQHIVAIKANEVGYFVSDTDITTQIIAEVDSIDPDTGIPEYSVELNLKTGSGISACDCKMLAIPSDTGFGKSSTDGFESMVFHLLAFRLYKW